MALSQLALEDVGALYLGSSFLMADPMGPLLDQDEEEALSPSSSLEEKAPASPPLSFSSTYASSWSPYQSLSSSPLSSASPPPSPPPDHPSYFLGTKATADASSLSWLTANDLLNGHAGADDGKDDAFAGMDWMSEKIDLSEFDLESLIGSCSSDESPSSPEDLLASLDPHMDLDLDAFDSTIPAPHDSLELALPLPSIPPLPLEVPFTSEAEAKKTEAAPVQEMEIVTKSEPPSPAPSPAPLSQTYTLELGSEVDVLDGEKTVSSLTATIIPDPSGSFQTTSPILLSLPTSGHIVVVLTNKEKPSLISLSEQSIKTPSPSSDCDSDSGIESAGSSPSHLPSSPSAPSPTAGSSRTKPYSKPEPDATSSPSAKAPRVKSVSGAPKVVEKKLKKMEQNKTAATRYRQKKRVEQEQLNTECEELEKRNRELTEKAESINREIQYLKDLMEEVRKHRRGKTSSVA
ncbi:cyclic AMP-dependent transcription factor ATF-4 [Sphaeramia orbicularis]|uniref:Cyclic AMP-dependent transcription factor ATF-4 n=1 Tax=Sphaeramia orbicularis TaxID=375764 RepID=A0A672ZH71_9TELE|nr:cyclic AMP-dependent transcription factor ATF-4-like [Sphaeramia orbicularis]XP_030018985.1 cyclic AMP-dependent transcription factor ATF-4-like [Sphaeramia orbicularis]